MLSVKEVKSLTPEELEKIQTLSIQRDKTAIENWICYSSWKSISKMDAEEKYKEEFYDKVVSMLDIKVYGL